MLLSSMQVVMPPSQRYTNRYSAFHRVCVLHVVNPETGKCYCGRDPDGWDLPFREYDCTLIVQDLFADNQFCKSCRKAISRRLK